MKHLKYLAALLLIVCSLNTSAQTRPAVKFKPLPLTTIIGGYKDSATISVAEAERIIGEKLYISDSKKVIYTISSFQFAYRKFGATEDEESGKVSPTYSLFARLFKENPMPAPWVQQIREQVKPGDELWFFDVIVKDVQGRVMYAPSVKFKVVK